MPLNMHVLSSNIKCLASPARNYLGIHSSPFLSFPLQVPVQTDISMRKDSHVLKRNMRGDTRRRLGPAARRGKTRRAHRAAPGCAQSANELLSGRRYLLLAMASQTGSGKLRLPPDHATKKFESWETWGHCLFLHGQDQSYRLMVQGVVGINK